MSNSRAVPSKNRPIKVSDGLRSSEFPWTDFGFLGRCEIRPWRQRQGHSAGNPEQFPARPHQRPQAHLGGRQGGLHRGSALEWGAGSRLTCHDRGAAHTLRSWASAWGGTGEEAQGLDTAPATTMAVAPGPPQVALETTNQVSGNLITF